MGPAGVKAKWVRIELRKIETLPGGGLANTFFDFVGQSPLNLWQSQGEYSSLDTVRVTVISELLEAPPRITNTPSTDAPHSKIFHSTSAYQSRYRQVSLLRKAVRAHYHFGIRHSSLITIFSRSQVRTYSHAMHQGQEVSCDVHHDSHVC